MTVYHKHHIIPRHMGGTDEPDNLVNLTVEEHAEAHRLLWEQHGKEEDYYAWKGLASHIGKEEIRLELARLGGRRSGALGNLANMSEESRRKAVETRKARPCGYNTPEHMALMVERSKSPEIIEKRKQIYAEIGHMQGSKNSQYGTFWITNGVDSIRVRSENDIPKGWYKGRKMKR
ncbi:HNH endonuclease [bacterium]|nr:HNH endonuclease [bacterium]